jgi:selenocysteine lyase/cysteine desulfurase
MESLESYFKQFREHIVGIDAEFESPYGRQKMVYADWIASGRLYRPIEERILHNFGPMIGNTHSESSETGVTMTHAYHKAHKIIKEHVNADENDVIITTGSGMTGVVNKLQRLLGLKVPEQLHKYCAISDKKSKNCLKELGDDQPVVFLTHLEHHSNHTSWLETIAEVVLIEPDENLMVDPATFRRANSGI